MVPEVEELMTALQDLHVRAGGPSTRSIAAALGNVSHTTVALALKGPRPPAWWVCAGLVTHLGGDEETFRALWVAATKALEARSYTGGGDGPMEAAVEAAVRSWLDDHSQEIIEAIARAARPEGS